VRETWDGEASRFDEQPDHGLSDPRVRAAWTVLLREALPGPPARVLDLGCGTGSLSVLLAELGHPVHGVDLSPRMLERAAAKARRHGVEVALVEGDAGDPPVDGPFDVVLARHVLWALPDVPAVLERWTRLLVAGGRLVLRRSLAHGRGAGAPPTCCRWSGRRPAAPGCATSRTRPCGEDPSRTSAT
jgi:ubiquinone/menaquinone biosynthesis C-methylase UbiE